MNYFNYFTEVEDTFIRRRQRSLLLSPLDWALIDTWKERGIPLHVVLRAIESVFDVYDKQPPGTRTIKTLFYCREEVEVQFKEWSAAQAGKDNSETETGNSGFSIEGIAAHIDAAIEGLNANSNENFRENFDRATARLTELKQNLADNFETIDKTLNDVEKLLDRTLLSNWEEVHLRFLEKEVASELKSYRAEMEKEAYKNLFDMMLIKRLREEARVPRLGLFYL